MIMELKWQRDLNTEGLERLAEEALAQIEKKRYDSEMREDGVREILKFGIAFSGKHVCVKTQDDNIRS